MSQPVVDPARCPLCQGDNDCGMAAGRGHCWCFSAAVPGAVRERIPEDALDRACICRSCLAAAQQSAAG